MESHLQFNSVATYGGHQPQFVRRHLAVQTMDSDLLASLACDEAYWVRREALKNTNTPDWVLDLLVRAGATPDLRGRGEADMSLDSVLLEKLSKLGSWAKQLVAEHPKASGILLEELFHGAPLTMRLAIARHENVTPKTLEAVCCDIERDVRKIGAKHPKVPSDRLSLLYAAGACSELQYVGWPHCDLKEDELHSLANSGPWGHFLAIRHPSCPLSIIESALGHHDWRVRSGLLDNPKVSRFIVDRLFGEKGEKEYDSLLQLSCRQPEHALMMKMAKHVNPEVRMAVARHPAASPDVLGLLAVDGTRVVRQLVTSNPNTNSFDIDRLIRAGSTPDLMGFGRPDVEMGEEELEMLSDSGVWARQLSVRHPNTSSEILARLLCDENAQIRQWATVHPSFPREVLADLVRAGSGDDLQGFNRAETGVSHEVLWKLGYLGPWGRRVVSMYPALPDGLVMELSKAEEWEVRRNIAMRKAIPKSIEHGLKSDENEEVRKAANRKKE